MWMEKDRLVDFCPEQVKENSAVLAAIEWQSDLVQTENTNITK